MKYLTNINKAQIVFVFLYLLHFTAFAQPKERLKNRYKEPSMSYGAPYTMFDIAEFAKDKSGGVAKRVEELIELIKHPDKDSAYFRLFKYYNSDPNQSPYTQDSSAYDPLAAHAKNKAFIALVGVDGLGFPLPSYEITRLQNEAYSALENMNTEVLNQIRFHHLIILHYS